MPTDFREVLAEFPQLLLFMKLAIITALLFYLFFAGVVIRQVQMMVNSLRNLLDAPIQLIAWVHFLLVLGVFLLAIVWL